MPSALSYLVRLWVTRAVTHRVASHPEIAAPSISTSGALLPVSMKASTMPGRAAWDNASPSKLCRRSTA